MHCSMRIVYGRFPRSHAIGIVALLLLAPLMPVLNLLVAGTLTTAVMVLVTVWEAYARPQAVGDGVVQHAG